MSSHRRARFANGWPGRPRQVCDEALAMTGPVDLAVVGNGRIAALVNSNGQLVWWCFPRFDSDPVFCRLIAGDEEKGFCDVVLERQVSVTSHYARNTATVVTILTSEDGAQVKI